jgi:exosortase
MRTITSPADAWSESSQQADGTTGHEDATRAGAPVRTAGLAVVFIGLLALFAPTVWSFFGTWSHELMFHGWLIGGLICWLVWRHRRDFMHGEGGDPLLLLPAVMLSMFWLLATVARIQVFHQLMLVLLVVCWGFYVAGRRNVRLVTLLGATMLLAVPIYSAATPLLRQLTVIMSGGMVKLLGIPADIQGDLIRIPAGTFQIADGCAGVAFFLSALAVGALYAHLMLRNWVAQAAVLCAAAGMAMVANWIRVSALIVIGHVTEMQSGLIADHGAFGWMIFTIGLVPFFMVARQIEKRLDSGIPSPPSAPPVDGHQYRQVLRRALLATSAAAVGPVVFYAVSVMPTRPAPWDSVALAGSAGWAEVIGSPARPFPWHPEYQGAARHETPVFTDGAAQVYVDRFVFQRQSQGAKLIGYPNRLADPRVILDERVVGPVNPARDRWVRQAIVASPDGAVLTWFWYRVGRSEAADRIHAKVLEVPAFFTRNRTAEFVAISTPCGPEDCAGAFRILASFTGAPVAVESEVSPPQQDQPQD